MVKPEDLAQIVANLSSGTTFTSQRNEFVKDLMAATVAVMSVTDREKFSKAYWTAKGYAPFTGEGGTVFMKGNDKRFVPRAPKPAK